MTIKRKVKAMLPTDSVFRSMGWADPVVNSVEGQIYPGMILESESPDGEKRALLVLEVIKIDDGNATVIADYSMFQHLFVAI